MFLPFLCSSVRSMVGLNKKAAKKAFAEFLAEAPLHADQISFLNEVVEYLAEKGTIEPKVMFETPFTNIHDQGISGVFGDKSKRLLVLFNASIIMPIKRRMGLKQQATIDNNGFQKMLH
jgi:hypothetical protein